MTLTKHVKFGAYWTLHVDIIVKISHFLLPAGGAIIIMQYWPLRCVQARTLINLISLGKIVHFMAELQQLVYSHGETSKLCHATMDTPFNENSRSSQFNIATAFTLD